MTTSSQFFSGGFKIGDLKEFPELGSPYPRDGEVWARTGIAYPYTSYPQAAANNACKINGLAATGTFGSSSIAISAATNLAGTWVVVDTSSATSVRTSTDNGQTYANRTHSVGVQANAVVWNAAVSRFVAFGNDGTIIRCAYSTDGVTWTAGGTLTPATAPVANTIRAHSDGTNIVAVWVNSSGYNGNIATTTNGAALTQRTNAANTSSATSNWLITALPGLGSSRWILMPSTGSTYQSTAADGSAWSTSSGLPSSAGQACGLAAGNGVIVYAGTTGYATSADGVTVTARSYPSLISGTGMHDCFAPGKTGASSPNWLTFDGTYFVTSGAYTTNFADSGTQGLFGYSTDGISWTTRQLTAGATVAGSQMMVRSGNGYLIALHANVAAGSGGTTPAQYSANWVTSPDYVGRARPYYAKGTTDGISGALPYYVKVQG